MFHSKDMDKLQSIFFLLLLLYLFALNRIHDTLILLSSSQFSILIGQKNLICFLNSRRGSMPYLPIAVTSLTSMRSCVRLLVYPLLITV